MAVIEAIESVYLEVENVTMVTFSSIPSTYENLQLRISSHDLYATTYDYHYIRLNTDNGSNYSNHSWEGYGSSKTSNAQTGYSYAKLGTAIGSWPATVEAPTYSATIIDFIGYADSNRNTTMMAFGGASHGAQTQRFGSSLWDNTTAVNRIDVYVVYTAPFQRGTEMTLYGIND